MMDRDEAMRIAAGRCREKGWSFDEPVEIGLRKAWFGGQARWEVRSAVTRRGGNVVIVIDAATGRVLRQGSNAR